MIKSLLENIKLSQSLLANSKDHLDSYLSSLTAGSIFGYEKIEFVYAAWDESLGDADKITNLRLYIETDVTSHAYNILEEEHMEEVLSELVDASHHEHIVKELCALLAKNGFNIRDIGQ